MVLRCSLCSREIDSSIENIIFYCSKCKPPQIYCSTCEREKLPRRGMMKKVVCVSCEKSIKMVKNLKKLPKELQGIISEGSAAFQASPEIELVEDNEFIKSYGRFCASCGSQLIAGAEWCPECGEKVE